MMINLTENEIKYIKFLVENRSKKEDIDTFGTTHIAMKIVAILENSKIKRGN